MCPYWMGLHVHYFYGYRMFGECLLVSFQFCIWIVASAGFFSVHVLSV